MSPLAALGRQTIAAGAVAALFATTGPLAIILAVAAAAGLEPVDTASWIFAGYFIGGVLTIGFSLVRRQPIGMAWTIPGTAMLFAAVDHVPFEEVVGAYLVTGLLITLLGLSGWVGRIMERIPAPVVMGMVAGVFLPIGVRLVTGFADGPLVASATVAGFLLVSAVPAARAACPPILGALAGGLLAVALSGTGTAVSGDWIARPIIYAPRFSPASLMELVPPLIISVIAIQNLQGFAVLRGAGHPAPVDAVTVACGYGTLAMGALGCVPAVLTGPANAMICGADPPESRYMAAIVFGALIALFGLFAPVMVHLAAAVPPAFIAVLGGLAILPILGGALRDAFTEGAPQGALVAFLVTVSDVQPFNIGAAFWGLIAGYAVWWLLERRALDRAGRPG